MTSNLYSEDLRSKFKRFRKVREKLKDSICKEILSILKHSSYHHVVISDGIFFGHDSDGFETEDPVDNIVIELIFDFNKLSSEVLEVTYYRGSGF